MARKTTTTHRNNNGPTHRTTTTRYNDGSSKSITRTGGNVLSSGKITRISRSDGKGNTRSKSY
ncbi:hypothetical protein [uncultured Aliiroseovarius sp.]|uniref:hypothetical protein n=1 Tax=uncultured Aliiroseovarius sp. TaxID=1658783 RepID=UPI00262C7389|nr:hypothetical protein [uncultured Aliiroseovarius sp.]